MSEIVFVASPAKHGIYFIFQIPNKLIKHNIIDPDQTYHVTLEPVKPIRPKNKKIREKNQGVTQNAKKRK